MNTIIEAATETESKDFKELILLRRKWREKLSTYCGLTTEERAGDKGNQIRKEGVLLCLRMKCLIKKELNTVKREINNWAENYQE